MSDDTSKQLIYSAQDVATLLNVKVSTVRKYANVLQKAGYHFYKNDKGHRGYYDHDVITLRKLIEVKNHPDMTLEQSADAVVSWSNQSNVTLSDTENPPSDHRYISYNEFKEFKDKQEEQMQSLIDLNKELVSRIDQQREHLDQKLDRRDENLMKVLNETLETKKLIAAAQEKEEEKKEEKPEENKGFFKRLFGQK